MCEDGCWLDESESTATVTCVCEATTKFVDWESIKIVPTTPQS